MKRILFVLAALIGCMTIQAQSDQLPEKLQKIRDRVDPSAIAGLHIYNEAEMLKKMKVKRAEKKLEVAKVIRAYNSEIASMKADNMGLLVRLGSDIKNIVQTKDWKSIFNAGSDYKGRVETVKADATMALTDMETALFEIVPKRKKRKYLKYKQELISLDQNSIDIGDVFSMTGL